MLFYRPEVLAKRTLESDPNGFPNLSSPIKRAKVEGAAGFTTTPLSTPTSPEDRQPRSTTSEEPHPRSDEPATRSAPRLSLKEALKEVITASVCTSFQMTANY
jgi:hypothetical protein